MQSLRRTLPETLDDLTVQVALVRPGPIQGGAVHPYIERRERLRADPDYQIPYAHPSLEPVLSETLGVIVFQDQVLEVVDGARRLQPGEAEGLRRAMSRKRSEAAIARLPGALHRGRDRARSRARGRRADLRAGARLLGLRLPEGARGRLRPARLPVDLAARALRARVPVRAAERAADGLLSARTRSCTRRNGAGWRCCPPHVNRSAVGVPGGAAGARGPDRPRLRPGREGGRGRRRWSPSASATGPIADAGDLAARSGAGPRHAGAAGVGGRLRRALPRREALWQMGVVDAGRGGARAACSSSLPLTPPEAPALRDAHRVGAAARRLRLLPDQHRRAPDGAAAARPAAAASRAARSSACRDGGRVTVAGLVVARQRPATAKGVTFMLLEDEWGTINLIVPPPVYQRHRLAVRAEPFVLASGRLERRSGTINVVVDEICAPRAAGPAARRREAHRAAGRTRDRSRGRAGVAAAAAGDLRAVLPTPHSFGRRGG